MSKPTFCVALIGNIASGKSLVATQFTQHGVSIFSADAIAKSLTQSNTVHFQKIVEHFGEQSIAPSGELDRQYLRDTIFSQAHERLWLERLLHPLIGQELFNCVASCVAPYCIAEIPLLVSRNHHPYIQHVLLVQAPFEQQIKRLINRDRCSESQALSILALQPNIEERRAFADEVLINEGSPQQLEEKIALLHQKYLKRANS